MSISARQTQEIRKISKAVIKDSGDSQGLNVLQDFGDTDGIFTVSWHLMTSSDFVRIPGAESSGLA